MHDISKFAEESSDAKVLMDQIYGPSEIISSIKFNDDIHYALKEILTHSKRAAAYTDLKISLEVEFNKLRAYMIEEE